MYEKIIITSDLSGATNHVIECVQDLKMMGTKEVILFHALGIKHLDTLQYDLMKLAEPMLIQQQQLLKRLGFSVKIAIGKDGVVWELRRVVELENASLVVIGTHGRGMAFDTLLGGVAHKIIHNATFRPMRPCSRQQPA